MGAEKTWHGTGLCIPDQRLTFANIDESLSTYTQAGERTGTAAGSDARSRLTPRSSGEQGDDIDVRVGRAGYAKTDPVKSGGLLIKDQTVSGYLGWNPPSVPERTGKLVNGIGGRQQTDLAPFRYGPFAQRKALSVNFEQDFDGEPITYLYDVEAPSLYWTSQGDVVTDASRRYWDTSITQLPDGRWLCLILSENTTSTVASWAMYMSDDDGDSWSLYDDDPFNLNGALPDTLAGDTGTANDRNAVCKIRACPDGSVVFVRFQETTEGTVNGQFTQWASPGLGSAFVNVSDWTVASPGSGDEFDFDLDVTPSGKVVLLRVSDATSAAGTGKLLSRVVGSAFGPLGDAADVTVYNADTGSRCGLCVLPTGVLVGAHCSSSDGDVKRFESYDDGATWRECGVSIGNAYDGDFLSIAGSVTFNNWQMCALGGGVMSVYSSEGASGDTTANNEPQWILWGGWTGMEYSSGDLPGGLSPRIATTWLPIELPGSLTAWTRRTSGGGGTRDIGNDGMLEIDTATSTADYYRTADVTTAHDALAIVTMQVDEGGSTAIPRVGIWARTTDGTDSWSAWISMSPTGYSVYDVHGTAYKPAVTASFSTPRQVMIWISGDGSGSVMVADRAIGERYWTVRLDDTLTANAGVTEGFFDFGHIFLSAGTASVSKWLNVQYVISSATAVGTLRPRIDTATSPTLRGAPMSLAPIYTPFGNADGANYLSVEGGPGRYAETWAIDREYDYPLRNAFTEVSPSPSKMWGCGSAAWDLVWDLDTDTRLSHGGSVFLYVEATKTPSVTLQGWNGSAWVDIITAGPLGSWPVGTSFGEYTVSGDTVLPAGSASGRYLWPNELAGGVVALTDGSGTVLRDIVGNYTGAWQDAGFGGPGVKQAVIRTATVPPAPSGSTEVNFVWPRWLSVAHNVGIYERYKVSSLGAYDADAKVATIMIGAFVPFGQQPSLGTTTSLSTSTTSRRNRRGTSHVRQDGPTARTVTMQWPDAADLYQIRGTAPSPDYIEAANGDPLATYQDVPYWLHGVFAELKSGEVPCVLATDVADMDRSMTDPTTFVYGRLTRVGDLTLRLGDEGSSEVFGVGATVMEEIK